MIVYYAIGGGLGHLTRALRVLEALGLSRDAAIVTASPHAHRIRSVPVIEVPARLEHAPDEHRAWLRGIVQDRLIADAFPGGIQGELCGLDVPMDYVARLLRWDEYRRAVPFPLPRFGTTWMVEELTPEHEAFVRANSDNVLPMDLRGGRASGPPWRAGRPPSSSYWVIVHSGPEHEVRELVEYTQELLAFERSDARVLVATQCDVELPRGFERVDDDPASGLFAGAARIVSAAGFNVMLETMPYRHKHHVVPFPRTFDDQFLRAARRKRLSTAHAPGPWAAR